ncbi:MAG: FkbM family methyltransferase [Nitrospira sp.]|nr:FkbM family methyltransferase [Nitrospira sp.]
MLRTTTKLALAKYASRWLCFVRGAAGLSNQVVVTRDGIKWELDTQEGIDLAIYLLGMFERETVMACRRMIKPGDVVLDIGANIGAHTLQLAKCVGPSGQVLAFEPTQFAFTKLTRNVRLNPDLESRVVLEQIMLGEISNTSVPDMVYSSWPLTDESQLHRKHRGRLMTTQGARACSLDDRLKEAGIQKVNLLKIDVDGHECAVLRGAQETLGESRPAIIMEVAPYVLEGPRASLEELCKTLVCQKYQLTEISTGKTLPLVAHELEEIVPDGCGMNVIAVPL